MAEKNQLGARLDPSLLKWIRETSEALKISQGELVAEMQKAFVESEATQKYPQWSAQIQDVNFWARSLVNAFMVQVEHGAEADRHAREEVQRLIQRKEELIADQLRTINILREEKRILENSVKEFEGLRTNLEDSMLRLGELRTINTSLLEDKQRLETQISKCAARMESMEFAIASYEAMRAERDEAIARNETERKNAQNAQAQAAELVRKNELLTERLNEALVAKAMAETEANSLRHYRDANCKLHETIGEQKAMIAILEARIAAGEQEVHMD